MKTIILFALSFVAMNVAWAQQTSTAAPSGTTETADVNKVPIEEYVPKGIIEGKWGTGPGEFGTWGQFVNSEEESYQPSSIAIDNQGNIYILDLVNERIQKFDSNGRFLMKFSTDTFKPTRIAVDRSGNIYIVPVQSIRSGKIKKYSSNGIFLSEWDVFSPPNDLFVDDKVYIGVNGGVKVYSLDGMFLYDAGIDFPNSLGGGSFIIFCS